MRIYSRVPDGQKLIPAYRPFIAKARLQSMQTKQTNMDRRYFLKKTGATGAGLILAGRRDSWGTEETPIELTPEHVQAVNRRRRVVVQCDPGAFDPQELKRWIAHRFGYADMPGSQIDSIWWDLEYKSEILPPYENPVLRKWWDQGIDWIQELIQETRKRNLEVFWHHRVNSVDIRPGGGLDSNGRSELL